MRVRPHASFVLLLSCVLLLLGGCLPGGQGTPVAAEPTPPATMRSAGAGPQRGAARVPRPGTGSPSGAAGTVAGLVIEPDDGRAPIEQAIASAERSLDLVTYLLTDRQIVAALKAAHNRGVRVRVMLEQHPYGDGPGNDAVAQELQAADVTTGWTNPAFRLTHQKTLIIDDATALVMTLNLTASAFRRNRDLAAQVDDRAAVAEIRRVFEADWNREAVQPTQPDLVWSPDNARAKLLALIRGARDTLAVYAEEMQDRELEDALGEAARRGVAVHVITSASQGGRDPNAPGRRRIARAGVEVRLLESPYVHAKALLADVGSEGAVAFVGSENVSTSSLDQNRELGVLLRDGPRLQRLQAVFERDWTEASEE